MPKITKSWDLYGCRINGELALGLKDRKSSPLCGKKRSLAGVSPSLGVKLALSFKPAANFDLTVALFNGRYRRLVTRSLILELWPLQFQS